MTFAVEITPPWEIVEGRDYQTVDTAALGTLVRAFLLRLPPGGRLHRHKDAGDVETYHVVLETNPQALNWWADETGEHSQHLQAGKLYRVNRLLEHWATNDGATPRTHLLLEFEK
jgi:hypothetical protein